MTPPKKKGRGGHGDTRSQPRATVGTNGEELERESDAAAKSSNLKKQARHGRSAAQIADSSGAAATLPGQAVVKGDKKTGKSATNTTSSTSKATASGDKVAGKAKQPEQQQAKRGRGHPRKQTDPGRTSTPGKVVTGKTATTTARKTSGSTVTKGKAADRATVTNSKKRRVESRGPPPQAVATPSASTEQQAVKDKRRSSDGDQSSAPPSKKASEGSKTSRLEGQQGAGSLTSIALEAGGQEKCRGERKRTLEEPQGKKKAGPADKGGRARGRGRPGRPAKRKGEALEDERDETPEEAIDEGDELGSGDSDDHYDEDDQEDDEAYDPMEDEEFKEKRAGGKGGRKRGGGAASKEIAKGKGKGKADATVPGKEEIEAGKGAKLETKRDKDSSTGRKKQSGRRVFSWQCPRCGGVYKGQQSSVYHIIKKVCGKVLTTMYMREGMYWNGKEKVILSEEQLTKPVGSISPPYPTLESLGKFNTASAQMKAAKLIDKGAGTCPSCLRNFSTAGGLKYHVERNVCGVRKPPVFAAEPTTVAASTASGVAEQIPQGGRSRRKAAVLATSALVTAAASSGNLSEASLEEDSDGNPKKKRRTRVKDVSNSSSSSVRAQEPPTSSGTAEKLGVSKPKPGKKSAVSKIQQALQEVARLDLEQDMEPGARRTYEEALRGAEGVSGIKAKLSWRDMPGLSPQWVSRRGGDAEGGDREDRAKISWEVTTVASWAGESRGGGGVNENRGRFIPSPVRVEMVPEDAWSTSGLKKESEGRPDSQRVRLAPFKSLGVPVRDGEAPETLLNAGGSVWDIDTLVRPGSRNSSSSSGGTRGSGGTGDGWDLFLAVAIGPLRQTDEPIDEVDAFLLPPLRKPSPLPVIGQRAPGPGLLQIWRAKNYSSRSSPLAPSPPLSFQSSSPADGGSRKRRMDHLEEDESSKESDGVFELGYGIAHDGGTVLHCKWAPEGDGVPGMLEGVGGGREGAGIGGDSLGLLAAVFEDGSLRVYLCPDPDEVSARFRGAGSGGGGGGMVVNIDPIMRVELKRAVLTCVDWNTHDPDLLLAGASDGSVCVWRVSSGMGVRDSEGTTTNVPPFRQFACAAIGIYEAADACINDVAWCPDSRDIFASTGHGHLLSMWELSNVSEPLCSFPLKNNRSEGARVRWAPGSCFTRASYPGRVPSPFDLDFFTRRDGVWAAGSGTREVLYRAATRNHVKGSRAVREEVEKGEKGRESDNPPEDAVWGLDIIRENPMNLKTDPDAMFKQQIHLAAWTVPSGQVRVTFAACRESAPMEHHHLSAAFVEECWRSKKSQCISLKENVIMHRLEYVHPDDSTVVGGASWPAREGSEGDGGGDASGEALPFLRVFTGCHSEGSQTVRWKEELAPLTGLLHCARLVYVPKLITSTTTAPPKAHLVGGTEPVEPSCVLLSGGHGGLIRCSVVPKHVFKPNRSRGPRGRMNKQRAIATAAAKAARAARAAKAVQEGSMADGGNASSSAKTGGVPKG